MPRPLVQDPGRIVTWRATDGVVLRGREWAPTGDIAPRGLVLFLHGIQSHSGWYAWTCGNLARAGYRVLAPDRRGSGMNEGVRGHAMSATQWIDDTTRWLREAKPRTGQRAALLGVSWGAKLAVATARRHPELVDALGLLYPGLYSRFELRWHQRWRLAVARGIGLWQKRIPIPLDDPALFTDDPAWREFIRHDPLSLREMTVGFLSGSLELDTLARGTRGLVQPLLLMTARRDAIIDNPKTVDWFAQQPAADKTLLDYDGCHTLEFEPCREAVLTDLIRWLDRTLAGSGAIG